MRRGTARHVFRISAHTPGRTAGYRGGGQAAGLRIALGAIVANEKAAATIGPGMHGSTFGGSALACRVALEFFDILEGLLPSIQRWAAICT